MNRLLIIMCTAALALSASPVLAQQPADDSPPTNAEPTPPPEESDEDAAPAPESTEMTVTVIAKHGTTGKPVTNVPVFLRAARPRGPFEPTAPKPQFEWTEFADAEGKATFSVPKTLTSTGLRIHAVTTYDGLAFESTANPPIDGARLTLDVYEKGLDPSVVELENLRTVVDIWEHYLVFTQYYTLTNNSETALDIKLLPDEEYEKGIPIVLPVKAQGINVTGPGENIVVNSTVYWKGVIKPGERVNLQARFSMAARDPEFTYEQEVGYPTKNVEVVVPIQTRFEKVPRLEELELRPLGFEETERGPGIFGLRDDIEFVGARGLQLKEGESFAFQVRGLPFHRPMLPWAFLLGGILIGLVGAWFGLRETKRSETNIGKAELRSSLERERAVLLDELVALEKDFDENLVTPTEYEFEASSLREQLALVLARLKELDESDA